MAIETTTLGGGCFWCLEAAFQQVRGVQSVVSGYAGGARPDPTYQQVCTGATGHAEVVQISFDNAQVDFETLLEVFFTIHDPTTLNRQGADVGTQYRSVIFHHSDEQRLTAEQVMARLSEAGTWSDPIVTQLQPAPTFYPAESYHQDYFRRNPGQGYCSVVISPKLAKLRTKHADLLTS
ncbi:peptide-methionine (S)-S-oxide reductase MsrA [Thiorhodococcus minor]|uniref:Peptide methionine sulfoxide reductase MsrA n=1 Tax=Thiorhodococcus minor TaxID=57489 RepID=A0A6M0K085_9GAMM|nr:peptide-methionine (S)-S-oxide reductase MsrA [Thiorhodococcus minor]NEV63140.1 peptide-methionine (S)-S-oxide reductase MsrA [Thiorhodococcus minor]